MTLLGAVKRGLGVRFSVGEFEDIQQNGVSWQRSNSESDLITSTRSKFDFYISFGSVHSDSLSIFDQLRSILHSHNCRQAIFPCDNCSMSHQPAYFGDQAFDRNK